MTARHRTRGIAVALTAALIAAATVGMSAATAQSIISVPGDFPAVQSAINAANDGDIIEVGPGTYVENLEIIGKSITLRPSDPANPPTIDGGAGDDATLIISSLGSEVRGLRITNNGGTSRSTGIEVNGGAPLIVDNEVFGNTGCAGAGVTARGSARIEGNHIHDNHVAGCSGGTGGNGVLIIGDGETQLVNNLIENNSHTSSGGGVSLFAAGSAVVEGNIIRGNSSGRDGGGLRLVNRSPALIANNLFIDNTASTNGGGISFLICSGCDGMRLYNNTFVNNTAPLGSQVYAEGFDDETFIANNIFTGSGNLVTCDPSSEASIPQFGVNLFHQTGGGTAFDCDEGFDRGTIIEADPRFDPQVPGAYRLFSSSPAVDAGDDRGVLVDFEGDPRPTDGNADGIVGFDLGWDETPDREAGPAIVAGSVTVVESDNTTTAHIPVTLTAPSAGVVTAEWTTVSFEASTPDDLPAQTGELRFEPGETSTTIDIEITGDLLDEDTERAIVRLTSSNGGPIGGFFGLGIVEIIDNDDPPSINPGATTVVEPDAGSVMARVPVTLSEPSGRTVSVDYRFVSDFGVAGASAGDDFTPGSGTVVFEPGQQIAYVDVPILGDRIAEPDELLVVHFFNAVNGTPGGFFGLGFVLVIDRD